MKMKIIKENNKKLSSFLTILTKLIYKTSSYTVIR